jgi:hypothetical protein
VLTVIYITNRGLFPLVEAREKEISQYALLADSLREQHLRQEYWNLVVVDKLNPLPRHELDFLGDRVRYTRPRETPWQKMGVFAAASARNSGMLVADGDVILGLDDCVSFDNVFLEMIVDYARRGQYLAPLCCPPGDLRTRQPPRRQKDIGGVLSYPRETAIRLGMYDERFDGTEAFEDLEFSHRLAAVGGVEFYADDSVRAVLHPHNERKRRLARCAKLVNHLLHDSQCGNEPWTIEQLETLCTPCRFSLNKRCQVDKLGCRGMNIPSSETVEIMRSYETLPWTLRNQLTSGASL